MEQLAITCFLFVILKLFSTEMEPSSPVFSNIPFLWPLQKHKWLLLSIFLVSFNNWKVHPRNAINRKNHKGVPNRMPVLNTHLGNWLIASLGLMTYPGMASKTTRSASCLRATLWLFKPASFRLLQHKRCDDSSPMSQGALPVSLGEEKDDRADTPFWSST